VGGELGLKSGLKLGQKTKTQISDEEELVFQLLRFLREGLEGGDVEV